MSFSLGGLASGLDTNTLITQLMQLERIPYTKLENRQKEFNSELSVFRSINTKLNTLRSAAESLLEASNFNLRSAVNSDGTVLKATALEDAAESVYNFKVIRLATQHSIKSKPFEVGGQDSSLSGEINIKGNGKSVTILLDGINNEENLKKIVKAVNEADVGVRASLVETKPEEKTLIFTSSKSGEQNELQWGAHPESTEDKRTFINASEQFQDLFSSAVEAKNASINMNGVVIESPTNELNDVISGLSLTLFKEGEATVTVNKDADKIAGKVEAFVNAFNDVVNTIRSNISRGKSLQGDATLRSLQDQLYNKFNAEVGGTETFKYMHEIGLEIDKGKKSGSEMTGTISFDKDKFKEALATNPDDVFKLFAHDDENLENKDGIAQLFNESLRFWTRSGNGILTTRIKGYDSELSFITKQMEDLNIRLQMKEDQLKKQFIAMESSLIQLQNQQVWMSSQLASLYAS